MAIVKSTPMLPIESYHEMDVVEKLAKLSQLTNKSFYELIEPIVRENIDQYLEDPDRLRNPLDKEKVEIDALDLSSYTGCSI